MINDKVVENENLKEKDSEKNQSRVWIGDDNIIYITIAKKLREEDIWKALDKTEELLKGFARKGKVLIDMSTSSVIRSSQFRRVTVEKVKEVVMNSGLEKAAIFGGGIVLKTIAFFIVMASGMQNVKIFNTSKEALEWLKQP